MRIGFLTGRFQPLHFGHTLLIKHALKVCKKVIVGIGSSQESRTDRNPFTFEERKQMLENVFGKELKKGSLKIIKLIDINDPPNWVAYVEKEIKKQLGNIILTDYFAGTKEDAELFTLDKSFKVHVDQRYGESGTGVRAKIKSGDNSWVYWVPKENHDLVREVLSEKNR